MFIFYRLKESLEYDFMKPIIEQDIFYNYFIIPIIKTFSLLYSYRILPL